MRTAVQTDTTQDVLKRPGSDQKASNSQSSAETQGYELYWKQIKQRVPDAVLLRGPAALRPLQVGDGDLDILLTSAQPAVESFLKEQGFFQTYKSRAYLRRFQLFRPDVPFPFTIEIYTAERWGLGFQLAGRNHAPADPDIARVLHAIIDGKGTNSIPRCPAKILRGHIGQRLWKWGNTTLLTLYLVAVGLIRPDFVTITRGVLRKIFYRVWQLANKSGLEVGLIGPDGSGKSSLAGAMRSLPLPVQVIYMGYNEPLTSFMRFTRRRRLPAFVKKSAAGYDFFLRRLKGWLLSRRGWVVIYDRHPAERLMPKPEGLQDAIGNSLKRLYAWPLDLTFWLTGDYEKIAQRKHEQSAAELELMDIRFAEVLYRYKIRSEKINVISQDAEAVARMVRARILSLYRERQAMDALGGLTGAILRS